MSEEVTHPAVLGERVLSPYTIHEMKFVDSHFTSEDDQLVNFLKDETKHKQIIGIRIRKQYLTEIVADKCLKLNIAQKPKE